MDEATWVLAEDVVETAAASVADFHHDYPTKSIPSDFRPPVGWIAHETARDASNGDPVSVASSRGSVSAHSATVGVSVARPWCDKFDFVPATRKESVGKADDMRHAGHCRDSVQDVCEVSAETDPVRSDTTAGPTYDTQVEVGATRTVSTYAQVVSAEMGSRSSGLAYHRLKGLSDFRGGVVSRVDSCIHVQPACDSRNGPSRLGTRVSSTYSSRSSRSST